MTKPHSKKESEYITLYQIPSPSEGYKLLVTDKIQVGQPVTDAHFRSATRITLSILRTPLTGMMGYLAMMSQGDFGKLNPTHKNIIDDLLKENKRLIVVVNELMELEKLKKGAAISRHHHTTTKKFKILHFEDENFLTKAYALKFSAAGFDYKSYPNPTSNPVGVVKTEKPDLIIMGIIMPVMDGITATKLIKSDSLTKDIPIIGMDNLGQAGDNEKFLQAGMSDYWLFAENTIIEVVNKVGEFLRTPIPASKKNQGNPKILIFEDDKFLADMYGTKLRMNGFDVAVYYNPTLDPVGVVVKEKPDLISSGIIMPVMTGYQAVEKIKADQRTKHIPVVFLSNLGQKEDIEKAQSLGATDYFVKAHFTPAEIVKKFYHILGLPIPPEKPIPPPGEAWHGQSVKDQPADKPKSWWQKLFR